MFYMSKKLVVSSRTRTLLGLPPDEPKRSSLRFPRYSVPMSRRPISMRTAPPIPRKTAPRNIRYINFERTKRLLDIQPPAKKKTISPRQAAAVESLIKDFQKLTIKPKTFANLTPAQQMALKKLKRSMAARRVIQTAAKLFNSKNMVNKFKQVLLNAAQTREHQAAQRIANESKRPHTVPQLRHMPWNMRPDSRMPNEGNPATFKRNLMTWNPNDPLLLNWIKVAKKIRNNYSKGTLTPVPPLQKNFLGKPSAFGKAKRNYDRNVKEFIYSMYVTKLHHLKK